MIDIDNPFTYPLSEKEAMRAFILSRKRGWKPSHGPIFRRPEEELELKMKHPSEAGAEDVDHIEINYDDIPDADDELLHGGEPGRVPKEEPEAEEPKPEGWLLGV